MLRYIQHSLHAYAKLALPFLTEAHALVSSLQPVDADARHAELHREHVSGSVSAVKHSGCCSKSEQVFEALCELDALHEAMLLNHVAKRASRAQGVAAGTTPVVSALRCRIDLRHFILVLDILGATAMRRSAA